MGGEARQLSVGRELRSRSATSSALLWVGGGSGRLSQSIAQVVSGLSDGTWRSPVAHLNGVQGVAGSNPAVPTRPRPFRPGALSCRRAFFRRRFASGSRQSGQIPPSLRLRLATVRSNPAVASSPAESLLGRALPEGWTVMKKVARNASLCGRSERVPLPSRLQQKFRHV